MVCNVGGRRGKEGFGVVHVQWSFTSLAVGERRVVDGELF